ncbi:copper chaperone CopZ [Gottschalkia acidurici 9a]|uniref:Copper chaperone CopZ n=1 Tax=Gottschalkia acidurici (strain ATCC 7906 / DSM 604 / BCRC 14475 / CIP 104303 / KCTC 5404 / NCIMB 10678 / 9a) TaxID=1128398 RepID=K0ATN8_GOTA9|nr:cation transporter [Gottschalkia acidurici]AFS77218.1 copper chaperone CopZ [Gottschalkia acidurici 9a]
MKKTILIEGMSCGHCTSAVTEALSKLSRVTSVDVNLEGKKAVIECENVDDKDIKDSIENIGFDVVGIE